MKTPQILRAKHKEFLREQGYKPKDFLLISEDYESYTFYHRKSGQAVNMRR